MMSVAWAEPSWRWILAFTTIENANLESLEIQLRFLFLFGSVNSNYSGHQLIMAVMNPIFICGIQFKVTWQRNTPLNRWNARHFNSQWSKTSGREYYSLDNIHFPASDFILLRGALNYEFRYCSRKREIMREI